MSAAIEFRDDLEQGSDEWLALRKTKITATDASVIMGVNPWKTISQLYKEKKSEARPTPPNERMKRGTELEPVARDLFNAKTGYRMIPKVVVKEWAMASLDGINSCNEILEVKCPGENDHALAISGKIPDYYFPQLQHQMYVCNSDRVFYYSFDGVDGVGVVVRRDEKYIEKMVKEELKFLECLNTNTPPEPAENEYIERTDDIWKQYALRWKHLNQAIKTLQTEEEELRAQLIQLSGGSSARGADISLCKVLRKGNIEYTKIPILKGMDLEEFRKPSTYSWRITC